MSVMKKPIYRCLLAALLACCLAALFSPMAFADTVGQAGSSGPRAVDAKKTDCSITLKLGDGSGDARADMVGGTIALYHVASLTSEGVYDIADGAFADSPTAAPIPGLDSAELDSQNAELAAALEKEALLGSASPVASVGIAGGKVTFSDIPVGLYLLCQPTLSQGDRKMTPFLLSVPDADGKYDVVCEPKKGIYTPSDDDPLATSSMSTVPADSTSTSSVSAGTSLPKSGDTTPIALIVLCAGIAAIVAGIALRRGASCRSASG